jgi:hypothetical protein
MDKPKKAKQENVGISGINTSHETERFTRELYGYKEEKEKETYHTARTSEAIDNAIQKGKQNLISEINLKDSEAGHNKSAYTAEYFTTYKKSLSESFQDRRRRILDQVKTDIDKVAGGEKRNSLEILFENDPFANQIPTPYEQIVRSNPPSPIDGRTNPMSYSTENREREGLQRRNAQRRAKPQGTE